VEARADFERKLLQGFKIGGAALAFLLLLFFVTRKLTDLTSPAAAGPSTSSTSASPGSPTALAYTIHEDEETSTPLKSQVVLHISVSSDVNESNLRQLLDRLYIRAMARTGFQYHEHPTNVFIYVYATEAHYRGRSPNFATLAKGKWDAGPSVTVWWDRYPKPDARAERHGLTLRQRKALWSDYIDCEDRARSEAEALYPPSLSESAQSQSYVQREALRERLLDKYRGALAARHGLSAAELEEIGDEGMAQHWPFPESKWKSSFDR